MGFQERRQQFGDRLRQLREARQVTAKDFAARVDWDRSKVSRLETGKYTPSDDDLATYLATLDATDEQGDQLRAELTAVHEEYVTWRQRLRAGHLARQEEAGELEAAAKVIRGVDVGVVPGLLQTPDYARHVLLASAGLHGAGKDVTEAVRARMRRQQVLYEPGKSIELLMTESALLHPIGPAEVMAGQLSRLVAAIGMPNVRIGILPATVRLPVALIHAFWIIDHVVLVETMTAELRLTDPDEVSTYSKVADQLWSAAVEHDEARDLLLRLTDVVHAGEPGQG